MTWSHRSHRPRLWSSRLRAQCATAPVAAERSLGVQGEALPGGALCTEHFFRVPLDYAAADNAERHIVVFVREIVLAKHAQKAKELPVLLFLQGGPGFPSARPTSGSGGWLGHALEEHRVLLLDQRGTGRSTPATAQTLQHLQPADQAAYLSHFRADSIVKDCEAVRLSLAVEKLSILGQSFGGFCALTYLSHFPDSIENAYLTCGLAPVLSRSPDEVYRATYQRILKRNQRYYARYPGDVKKVREIIEHLEARRTVALPGGGQLTPRRFLSLGLLLGSRDGLEAMHWLVEDAFVDVDGKRQLDYRFLVQVEASQSFDTNPIYWLLQESIYCGPGSGASRWSAERVLEEPPFREAFDYRAALADATEPPVMFTGEMVYSWFADDFATLKSLAPAAEILAAKQDWPPLYDIEALRNTRVNVAAAVSYDDVYVERAFSEEVAELLGDKCNVWITNEIQHSGLRDDGAAMLQKLMGMAKGIVGIPS